MPTLSVIILSHNRRDALLRTLTELFALTSVDHQGSSPAIPADFLELIVVDNASKDGTVEQVRVQFPVAIYPNLVLLALPENVAIEGFNLGAARASGQYLLILDDDAWPDRDSLGHALNLLEQERSIAGVALLPVHPRTNTPEWRFAASAGDQLIRRFPVFGCANIVRASAWQAVGGYEREFLLYRNDVDLALKLLGAGFDVAHNPGWFAWHDSPGATRKSDRWLRLATRNWVWLARRHAQRWWQLLLAIGLHIPWTIREAGLSASRLGLVWAGLSDGLRTSPPGLPNSVRRSDALWRLIGMQVRTKYSRRVSIKHS